MLAKACIAVDHDCLTTCAKKKEGKKGPVVRPCAPPPLPWSSREAAKNR